MITAASKLIQSVCNNSMVGLCVGIILYVQCNLLITQTLRGPTIHVHTIIINEKH